MKFAPSFASVAARLRARGFTVVEVDGWATRGVGGGDFVSVDSVGLHHTATGGNKDYASLGLVTNGRGGPSPLRGPLCNFGVGRLGTIYLVAAGYANHAGETRVFWQGNRHSVGIEAENNGVGEPWAAPITLALLALVQELQREFSIPTARVLGHKEICSPGGRKVDPSFDCSAFRSKLSTSALLTKGALMAVDELLPQGNHYSGNPETLGWAVRELEPRLTGQIQNVVNAAVLDLEARLNARIDAVPAAVVEALLARTLLTPTFRDGGVVVEPTRIADILPRAAEASVTRNLQKGSI